MRFCGSAGALDLAGVLAKARLMKYEVLLDEEGYIELSDVTCTAFPSVFAVFPLRVQCAPLPAALPFVASSKHFST